MTAHGQRARGGAHRKHTSPVKNRVALVAIATGTVTGAGAGGAAVATAQNAPTPPANAPQLQLASQDAAFDAIKQFTDTAVPQILAIPEFKPVEDLALQLQKAVDAHAEQVAEDLQARMPATVRPAEGVFTSGFGARWGAMHNGVDIANALGTPIVAAEDGTVIDAGPAQGFGQWVRILHEDGTVTVYGHMETIDVAVGQHVSAGQKIAGMGSRGFSTGVHLHFEVHPAQGAPIDPIPWLAERGINL
ncbi:M23 family metallopeptidase [Corynebacterium choanae]|uniref:Murein hydrolase activator NlpD n=1 Tax=Corynebacterium choanae TaxID=1862358 RepID=A0A3G6J842_9CORY|nr:M23 family metallopeptidase [Corynebacterium choanae]AZA13068.1 Murein hydrolase activator NlpD precursor [Corynebacterium choanae]